MKLHRLITVVAMVLMLCVVAGTQSAPADAKAAPARQIATPTERTIAPIAVKILRKIAFRLLINKFVDSVAVSRYDQWVDSGMRRCPSGLPRRLFCERLPSAIRAVVFTGYAGAMAFPSPWPTRAGIPVPAWVSIGVSCWTSGRLHSGQAGPSNAWFRTYDGAYYPEGHMDPYSLQFAIGLPRC